MANVAVEFQGMRKLSRSPARYLFGIAFTIAACLTAVAVWYVSSAPGATSSIIAAPSSAMLAVLWATLVLILALGPMLGIERCGFRLRLESIVSQGYCVVIYVIGGKGQVLAKAEGTSPKSYPAPSLAKLREAQRDFLISDVDVHDSLTSLYRLRGY